MKKFLILALALSLVVVVSGCGKKPKVEAPTTTTTTTRPSDDGNGGRITEPPVTSTELAFETVYFDFDKYNLRDDARRGLNHNYNLLRDNPGVKVLIEGHCDERGTIEYNLALGERRARSALEYLVSLGIDRGRMTMISYGKERPAVLGSNESAWSRNRRCEFIVVD